MKGQKEKPKTYEKIKIPGGHPDEPIHKGIMDDVNKGKIKIKDVQDFVIKTKYTDVGIKGG